MIVLVMGYNAAGKSTHVTEYTDKGYHRLNRDELGGKLDNLPKIVADLHKKGTKDFVLDNTYVDIESRKSIIECGKKLGLPVKCVWLDTSFENAQFNACQRMIRKAGRLLDPEDFKGNKDPNLFPPVALFTYKKKFQKPTILEGFTAVETVHFIRKIDSKYCNKALILDYDDTLRQTDNEYGYPTKPAEINILLGRKEKLNEYVKKGYKLLGASNQSGIAKKVIDEATAIDLLGRTNEMLGQDIDYYYCKHSIPPISCYCRKPMVGIFVHFMEKHLLDPEQCIFVGDQTTDKTFAQRCGIKYFHPDEFFV